MLAMHPKVLDAKKRMARYYIQRLYELHTLSEQGGHHMREALDRYDAESNQIEQTLAWLDEHSDDDVDAEDLFSEMLIAGRLILPERVETSQLLGFYQKALATAEVRDDVDNQLVCLGMISKIYTDLSQLEQSYAYSHRRYDLAWQSGQQQQIADSMYEMGAICTSIGREAEARDWLQNAVSLYLDMRNPQKMVDCFKDLAWGALQLGDWTQSQQHLDRAYDIVMNTDNLYQKRTVLKTLSDLKEKTGDRDAVVAYRNEVLDIAIASANKRDILHAHLSLAITYDTQADFLKSQHHYRAALKIADQMGFQRFRLVTLGNLGYSHYLAGDYHLARDYTAEALSVLLDEQNHYFACVTMANLVAIYAQLKALSEARHVVQDGMQLAVDLENPQLQVMMVVAGVQYLVALAQSQSNQQQDTITTGVLWAGFVYTAEQAEEENRTELDKLRPAMDEMLGAAQVETLLKQGESLTLEGIIDHHILQRL